MPIDNINDVTISQLKIKLHTNIPSNPELILTYDLLYQPTNEKKEKPNLTSAFPFFTFDIKYPNQFLYNMTYDERIMFFFNYDRFKEVLKDALLLEKDSTAIEETEEEYEDEFNFEKKKSKEFINGIIYEYLNEFEDISIENESEENPEIKRTKMIKKTIDDIDFSRKEISDHNISLMLEVLFPTTFPTVNNVNDSYNEYLKESVNTKLSIKGALPSVIQPMFPGIQLPFSYLKLNTTVFTVVKSLWLNDMLNNPDYKRLIVEFIEFFESSSNSSEDFKNRLVKLTRVFFQRMNIPSETDLLNGVMLLDSKIELREKSDDKSRANVLYYENLKELSANFQRISDYLIDITNEMENKSKKSYLNKTSFDNISNFLDLLESTDYTLEHLIKDFEIPYILKNFLNYLLRNTAIARVLNKLLKSGRGTNKNVLSIDISSEENIDIATSFKSIYPKYIPFTMLINSFVSPNIQTTNLHLQKILNDYANGTNGDLYDLIYEYIRKKYLLNIPVDASDSDDTVNKEILTDNLLYIGLKFYSSNEDIINENSKKELLMQGGNENYYTTDYQNEELQNNDSFDNILSNKIKTYEIDVLIDVIGGQIDDNNKSIVNCKYNSQSLGSMFTKLLKDKYSWSVRRKPRFYITLNELQEKNVKKRAKSIKQKYKLGGGKKKTKFTRKKYN